MVTQMHSPRGTSDASHGMPGRHIAGDSGDSSNNTSRVSRPRAQSKGCMFDFEGRCSIPKAGFAFEDFAGAKNI